MGPIQPRVLSILVSAIAAISSAGVLVKGIAGVDAWVIAFWRMAGSAIVLAPFVRKISPKDALKGALSGLFLALHFGFWFASLQKIPVMRSTLLVTLAPIWAGLLEWVVLKRPPNRYFWIGLGLALPGVVLLSGGDISKSNPIGDVQALIAGVAGASYFVIGSRLRQRMKLATYTGLVCFVAACALLPVVLASELNFLELSNKNWLLIAALIAGPQLIGHNGLNYVLKYLPASLVTATTLLEPFGAAFLAWLFLHEVPFFHEMLGGLLIVFGIFHAIRNR